MVLMVLILLGTAAEGPGAAALFMAKLGCVHKQSRVTIVKVSNHCLYWNTCSETLVRLFDRCIHSRANLYTKDSTDVVQSQVKCVFNYRVFQSHYTL